MSERIGREHDMYKALVNVWQREAQPARVLYNGHYYLAIRDNDELFFVPERPANNLYDTSSFRR